MKTEVCCDRMRFDLEQKCSQHQSRWDCPDNLIHRWDDGTYAIIVHDGGCSAVVINYCPFCGELVGGFEYGQDETEGLTRHQVPDPDDL